MEINKYISYVETMFMDNNQGLVCIISKLL